MSRKKLIFYLVLISLLLAGSLITWRYYKKQKGKLTLIEAPEISATSSLDAGYHARREGIIFYDFEDQDNNQNRDQENAYSGKYCGKVFGSNSFSPIITKRVSEIGKGRLERAGISAYIYVYPQNAASLKASLVFSVNDIKDNNVVWKSVEIAGAYFKPGSWQKVSGAFDIDTTTIPEGCVIKAYLWNDSKTNILIDDIMVIVGKDTPLRGDTTWCDISGDNSWQQSPQRPPFPYTCLMPLPVGNNASPYLVKNSKSSGGLLMAAGAVCAGNFYNPANNRDKLLVLQDDTLSSYSYCDNNKNFSCDFQTVLKPEDSLWLSSRLLPARYCGKAADEILLQDTVTQSMALYYIGNATAATCTREPSPLKIHRIWQGNYNSFSLNGKSPVSIWPIYLSPVKKASLLCIYADGHWQIFEFQKSEWATVAVSNKPNKAWAAAEFDYTLVNGRFSAFNTAPQIISISTSKRNKQSEYSIMTFNNSSKTLNTIFPQNTSDNNKTTLLDAVSSYYVMNGLNDGANTLLKYDKTWRFDLKLLAFGNNTVSVLYNVDFKGFAGEYNPKYYENTFFAAGAFSQAGVTTLLTWCYNNRSDENKNQPLLPDALYLFSFQNSKK